MHPSESLTEQVTDQEMKDFTLNSLSIRYPQLYYIIIREVFIFDVYKSNLLRKNDVVLDLGATVGEFSILASKRIGEEGKVIAIEPNPYDYKLLKFNIKKNNCSNIVPINMGVGGSKEKKEMSFRGKGFRCQMDTLENILDHWEIKDTFDFVKMDIEGYELDVLTKSINTIRKANVISIEMHGSKKDVDNILLPCGFTFHPLTNSYCIAKMVKNVGLSPRHLLTAIRFTIAKNPGILYKLLIRNKMRTDESNMIMGSYIRGGKLARI